MSVLATKQERLTNAFAPFPAILLQGVRWVGVIEEGPLRGSHQEHPFK